MSLNILPSKEAFFQTASSFQPVDPSSLPEDERTCCICTRTYNTDDNEDTLPEIAVGMPCGHIIGKNCITKWLNPDTGVGSNICPLDRMELFEKPRHMPPAEFSNFIEHLRDQGDDSSISLADYLTEETMGFDETMFSEILPDIHAISRRPASPNADDDETHYRVRMHEEGSSALGAAIENFFRIFTDAPLHYYTILTNFDIIMAPEHGTDPESAINHITSHLSDDDGECPHSWPFIARKRVTDAAIFWTPWTGRHISRERMRPAQLAVHALVLGIEREIRYLKGSVRTSRRLFNDLVRAAGLSLRAEMGHWAEDANVLGDLFGHYGPFAWLFVSVVVGRFCGLEEEGNVTAFKVERADLSQW